MSDNEPIPIEDDDDQITDSTYKFIDGFPSRNEIKKRKSYTMSYNQERY